MVGNTLEISLQRHNFGHFWYRVREICLSEVELLDWEKFNPDFSKGIVVFLPYYILICFKGLLGLKKRLKLVLENWNMLRSWEKKEENKEKGLRIHKNVKIIEWNSSGEWFLQGIWDILV